jgi:hypothetical protein
MVTLVGPTSVGPVPFCAGISTPISVTAILSVETQAVALLKQKKGCHQWLLSLPQLTQNSSGAFILARNAVITWSLLRPNLKPVHSYRMHLASSRPAFLLNVLL